MLEDQGCMASRGSEGSDQNLAVKLQRYDGNLATQFSLYFGRFWGSATLKIGAVPLIFPTPGPIAPHELASSSDQSRAAAIVVQGPRVVTENRVVWWRSTPRLYEKPTRHQHMQPKC